MIIPFFYYLRNNGHIVIIVAGATSSCDNAQPPAAEPSMIGLAWLQTDRRCRSQRRQTSGYLSGLVSNRVFEFEAFFTQSNAMVGPSRQLCSSCERKRTAVGGQTVNFLTLVLLALPLPLLRLRRRGAAVAFGRLESSKKKKTCDPLRIEEPLDLNGAFCTVIRVTGPIPLHFSRASVHYYLWITSW